MDNTLLVAAKNEYTEQLHYILSEYIYRTILSIWELVKEEKNALKSFQTKLCDIHVWNQEIINTHHKKILKAHDFSSEYLDKIIEAVFLSNIKILSVIKLQNKKQVININVPDTKNFIHKCFIESARQFYMDPYLIDTRESSYLSAVEIKRNVKRSYKIIKDCIEKTIRNMIPMEEILNKYLEAQDNFNIVNENSDSDEAPEPPIQNPEPPIQNPEPPVQYPEPPIQNPEPFTRADNVEDLFTKEPEQEPEQEQEPEINLQDYNQNEEKTIKIREDKEQDFFSDSD